MAEKEKHKRDKIGRRNDGDRKKKVKKQRKSDVDRERNKNE